MTHLTVSKIKGILNSRGFSPLKQLGQNFLVDENTVKSIASAAQVLGKNVIEVGPGLGALTSALIKDAKKLVAVEIDRGFFGYLTEAYQDESGVTFINQDILKTDLAALCAEHFDGGEIVLAANLPYYITSAVIMHFLESDIPLSRMMVMVQREVAERLCAQPGSKTYGALTAMVAYFGTPKIQMTVSPGCFYPQPDVESAVVCLDIENHASQISRKYMAFVKACFSMKRKTVVNNLLRAGYEKSAILAALAAENIDPMARAETLSTQTLFALTTHLTK